MHQANLDQWRDQALSRLREHEARISRPRTEVVDYLARENTCLTAVQLVEGLRAEGRGIGIATAYRTLELLERQQSLRAHDIGDGALHYEPTSEDEDHHHHHLVCINCGRVDLFEDPRLEEALSSAGAAEGFLTEDHEVVIRGRCRRCR